MNNYYVYVLQSTKDLDFYIGHCDDLEHREHQHNAGEVASTKYRRPLKLVYHEIVNSKKRAIEREKYLKTTAGRRFIKRKLQ